MKQPVTSLYEMYLECSGNRESTKKSKKRAFMIFSKTFDGGVDIASIRYAHGEDFRNYLHGRGVGSKSINLYTTHLIHFFKWLVKRELLRINPWSELTLLPTEDCLTRPFTEEEIARLYKVAFSQWKLLILLGYCSGLRQSEALNLVRKDFLFDKELLLISPKKNTPTTWKWEIKNRKVAYAPLPEFANIDGKRHFFHRLIHQRFEATEGQPYPMITSQRYAKGIEAKLQKRTVTREDISGNFDRQFKRICELACVEKGRYQGLRVAFVNKFRKANFDPKKVQTLARHKSLTTTMRYYAFEDQKELVSKAVNVFKH